MEYFILIATVLVLCCGLLFFIPPNKYPSPVFSTIVEVFAMIIIIASSVVVIGMIIWDANTRKQRDKKKNIEKKRKLQELKQKRLQLGLPTNNPKTLYDDQGNVLYKPPFFVEPSDSSEDQSGTLNEILEDLFAWRRIAKKLFLFNKKRKKIVECANSFLLKK